MIDWIRLHWPEGLVTFLFALLGWFVRKDITDFRKEHESMKAKVETLEDRTTQLETDRPTRKEIHELHDQNQERMEELRASVNATVENGFNETRKDIRLLTDALIKRQR